MGWEQRLDSNTGHYYFVDHNSRTTTWHDPRLSQAQSTNSNSAATINDKQQNQASQHLSTPNTTQQQRSRSSSPVVESALSTVQHIGTDVLQYEARIQNFSGTMQDKEYKYLEEMLTRHLLRLDNIQSDGDSEIRDARKMVVRNVQQLLDYLNLKASQEANDQSSTAQTIHS